ncbi:MAG: tRNA (N6-isopentenyl adenosine(37)-C2)-methylthiotransferase MiaB [Bacillota bacterium]
MAFKPQFEDQIQSFGQIGEGKTYFTICFGCQMNEHDMEVTAGILESIGYSAVASLSEADLIIINTCAVRRKPEEKVTGLLGKLKVLKEKKKDLIIAVGGCMTQQDEAAAYIKKRFHHVNLIYGTHALPRFPELLRQAARQRGTIVDIAEHTDSREGLPIRRSGNFKAWLPVIYGCNNFCSYCIVPHVRGRERSRSMSDILSEARSLAEQGYLELTLLGQNVNSYGLDSAAGYDFPDLLAELDRVEGLARIRFMTSHPKDLSPRLIETVRSGKRICEHFHLPVQSGSNRILERMNRRYTRESYLELAASIKAAIPGVALTTDIIVGFPGETEADFDETLFLVEETRFDNAFTFLYSPRRGTAAAALEDTLPRPEKEKRLRRLAAIQNKISLELNQALVGETVEVLVEGASKSNPALLTGRTRTNKLVHFTAPNQPAGSLLDVTLTQARTWNMHGQIDSGEVRR